MMGPIFVQKKEEETHNLSITSQACAWATMEIQSLEHLNDSNSCQYMAADLEGAQMRTALMN